MTSDAPRTVVVGGGVIGLAVTQVHLFDAQSGVSLRG